MTFNEDGSTVRPCASRDMGPGLRISEERADAMLSPSLLALLRAIHADVVSNSAGAGGPSGETDGTGGAPASDRLSSYTLEEQEGASSNA